MNKTITKKKLQQILSLLKGKDNMLIVMQDYPDPDAIASAVALRELAVSMASVSCSIAHGGIVGRSENRAIVKYLDLKFRSINKVDINKFDIVAIVDAQPETGNISLPHGFIPHIVIDHHPVRNNTRSSAFTDIRSKYGATSSILTEYLREAGIEPGVPLTTVLLYGIKSDTHDLGEEASKPDVDAFLSLYPSTNKRMLSKIERSKVQEGYFKVLVETLKKTMLYEHCIIAKLEEIDVPDMIGEVADLLLRNENSTWVLCYGFYENKMLLSLRTSDPFKEAGEVAQYIVKKVGTGGGHKTIAGAQISIDGMILSKRRQLERTIKKRFLRILGVTGTKGHRLT